MVWCERPVRAPQVAGFARARQTNEWLLAPSVRLSHSYGTPRQALARDDEIHAPLPLNRRMRMSRGLMLAFTVCLLTASRMSAQNVQRVPLGDRTFDVITLGTGTPTLVLESGAGEGATQWNNVIAQLAALTRVVAYSRAGHDGSSPASESPSVKATVADLHALLRALGDTAPVVLVGHSWGGLLSRAYASTYPREVAGLVLVDGTHERQWSLWQALNPRFRFVDSARAMLPTMPSALRHDFAAMITVESAPRVAGLRPIPATLPLALITALKPCRPTDPFYCRDPRALAVWRALHGELFSQSHRAIHLVSDQTGHYVMNDEPQLVVQAARFVLERARAQTR